MEQEVVKNHNIDWETRFVIEAGDTTKRGLSQQFPQYEINNKYFF